MNLIAQLCGMLVCLFIGALGVAIIIMISTGRIDLRYLVSEANHEASMSRFQLLIFTFVVAIAFFRIVEVKGEIPDIPTGVLTLLGISASTYAVGKGISYSREEGVTPRNGSNGGNSGNGDGRDGNGAEAAGHAAAAKESARQAADHATNARQAAEQTAADAAAAKQAADQIRG